MMGPQRPASPPGTDAREEVHRPTWTAASAGVETGDGRSQDMRAESLGAFLRELPILILVAFGLAFLLRTFVVQVFYIPSSSMEPTLMINDRILVDKVTYRFRDLRAGEIVVFEGDQLGATSPDHGAIERALRGVGQLVGLAPANARDYVKRVIGLPGDRVEIDDGTVLVNGVRLAEPYVAAQDVSDCGPLVVPKGRLFFLGDNRPNSADSRAPGGLGFVERDRVVGKAFLLIWPLGRIELLRSPRYADIPEPDRKPPIAPGDPQPLEGLCAQSAG